MLQPPSFSVYTCFLLYILVHIVLTICKNIHKNRLFTLANTGKWQRLRHHLPPSMPPVGNIKVTPLLIHHRITHNTHSATPPQMNAVGGNTRTLHACAHCSSSSVLKRVSDILPPFRRKVTTDSWSTAELRTGWLKKLAHYLYALTSYALTSSNIDWFSNFRTFFQCENKQNIGNNTISKDPTIPQKCPYTTL